MVIIFSSSLKNQNYGVEILSSRLCSENIPHLIVNPHALLENRCALLHEGGSEVSFFVDSKKYSPSAVYLLTNWRCDAVIRIPPGCNYPNVYRSRASQFLQDIRFSFEDLLWVPGKIEAIERGDSKLSLFKKAASVGLSTPSFTLNAFAVAQEQLIPDSLVYRKNLGFPFVVSVNKEKGCEVGVTTSNRALPSGKIPEFFDAHPWQWQEAVASFKQVRCFIVAEKIWAVSWTRPNNFSDYRYCNQVTGESTEWVSDGLPDDLAEKILLLMKTLDLTVASPEFLVKEDGSYVFIDLNPCGDWYGFFSESVNKEIVSSLVDLFKNK